MNKKKDYDRAKKKILCHKCGKDMTKNVEAGEHFILEDNHYSHESCCELSGGKSNDSCEFC